MNATLAAAPPADSARPCTPSGPGRARRGFEALCATLAALASAWIGVLMVLICADVIGLAAFSSPVYGVVEIVAATIVAVVFAQVPHALLRGRLTRADFVIGALASRRPGVAAALECVFLVAGLVTFALLARELAPGVLRAWQDGEYVGTRGIFTAPTWPIGATVLLGAALTALAFAALLLDSAPVALREPGGRRALGAALLVLACVAAALAAGDPSRLALGLAGIAALLVMILAGMHIPVAMLLVSLVGIALMRDNVDIGLRAIRSAATGSIDKFDFGVVPLFVLMGLLVDAAGLGRDAYRVAASLLRRVHGGLAIATVAANAVFAAITGISIASAAVFTRVAVPQMVAYGYSGGFAAGTVAGSSVLGMLIPPSLLLIIYGFATETSVGRLFIAAIVPGILLATLFCAFTDPASWVVHGGEEERHGRSAVP